MICQFWSPLEDLMYLLSTLYIFGIYARIQKKSQRHRSIQYTHSLAIISGCSNCGWHGKLAAPVFNYDYIIILYMKLQNSQTFLLCRNPFPVTPIVGYITYLNRIIFNLINYENFTNKKHSLNWIQIQIQISIEIMNQWNFSFRFLSFIFFFNNE